MAWLSKRDTHGLAPGSEPSRTVMRQRARVGHELSMWHLATPSWCNVYKCNCAFWSRWIVHFLALGKLYLFQVGGHVDSPLRPKEASALWSRWIAHFVYWFNFTIIISMTFIHRLPSKKPVLFEGQLSVFVLLFFFFLRRVFVLKLG